MHISKIRCVWEFCQVLSNLLCMHATVLGTKCTNVYLCDAKLSHKAGNHIEGHTKREFRSVDIQSCWKLDTTQVL